MTIVQVTTAHTITSELVTAATMPPALAPRLDDSRASIDTSWRGAGRACPSSRGIWSGL